MSYGAFVKLEDGIEGLVHISEMSWTKRISHPSELVNIGDSVDVVVLRIDEEKQEISLGMKQTQSNPWDEGFGQVPDRQHGQGQGSQPHQLRRLHRNRRRHRRPAPRQRHVAGPARSATRANWSRRARSWTCKVLSVDQERKRIALGLKQLDEDPWSTDIPNRYQQGQLVKGKVTKITNFGVFVGLEERASKACSTSRNSPTRRSRTRRTWSTSATRSR
jgi:small subunit ribosomal protein S1